MVVLVKREESIGGVRENFQYRIRENDNGRFRNKILEMDGWKTMWGMKIWIEIKDIMILEAQCSMLVVCNREAKVFRSRGVIWRLATHNTVIR
jgi:hypothetical protein